MLKFLAVIDYETFGDDYLKVAERVADRAEMIWFRAKALTAAETFRKAEKMRRLLPHAFLILSERPDIAVAAGFDGVQLNERSLSPETVEEVFPELVTGYSAHSLEEIEQIQADFFTLSPIFMTDKPYEVNPIGALDVTDTGKKVYALGGITVSSLTLLNDKGYYGYAGIGIIKGMI
ncbi:thiamine phosphate synthase [Geovibrio thiophilus]|uniref:thiamine phosphate synthase n=1 Tax=Geovibrio thiophilus TaxID=139438 RepID=UPI0013E38D09|nr:thiamine phosphate synthase [Geovibrio thiophilus]